MADSPEQPAVDVAIVSYFNPVDLPGGAERIAWAEAELLSETSSVAFLSASPTVDSAPFAQFRVGGWTRSLYHPAGSRRNPVILALFHLLSLFNPAVFVESLGLFRRLRPTTVHTHNLVALSPAIWLAARMSGARVVHTHHDLWLLCERATMTDEQGRPCHESQRTCSVCRALRPAKKAQIRLVRTEIFPSAWLRDRLHRSGPVVPSFATSHPAQPAAPGGAPLVAYVGALTPHKLGVLLEAFDLAANGTGTPIRLAIAGSGPLAGKVADAAKRDAAIDYLGQIDSTGRDRLLAEASVLVIPSTCEETSPLVFFEALAAGLPVVASNLGGITELEQFGNVILVRPGDAQDLAQALGGLLGDSERTAELRAAARQHQVEASPARFVAQLRPLLEKPEPR